MGGAQRRWSACGVRFSTTRSTLTSLPGTVLATMFAPGSQFSLHRDTEGAVLIDRDGRYFGVILNFLRHGTLVIDPGLAARGVYEESVFFGLDAIAAALSPPPPPAAAPSTSEFQMLIHVGRRPKPTKPYILHPKAH
ncbi:Kctd9 [Symbiodinium natans]|uniref:Kctd9 protein n=1 Tax=Symbiodinium natans TaxID=878477 RepID=A0A812NRI4_9DINO|nr:Kctd9 [Symbiodinium natans]